MTWTCRSFKSERYPLLLLYITSSKLEMELRYVSLSYIIVERVFSSRCIIRIMDDICNFMQITV